MQLCQNFGISEGGGFEQPKFPPRYATAADEGNFKVPVRSIQAYGEWRHSSTDS